MYFFLYLFFVREGDGELFLLRFKDFFLGCCLDLVEGLGGVLGFFFFGILIGLGLGGLGFLWVFVVLGLIFFVVFGILGGFGGFFFLFCCFWEENI